MIQSIRFSCIVVLRASAGHLLGVTITRPDDSKADDNLILTAGKVRA